jgi:hypothetical protein
MLLVLAAPVLIRRLGYARGATRGCDALMALTLLLSMLPSYCDLHAADYVVTSTQDTPTSGTLRWAIGQANAAPNPQHRILFNIPGAGLRIIEVLGSGLPAITQSVSIDGTSQPGYSGSPLIVVRGNLASLGANGFVFLDSTAQVSNLKAIQVRQFAANGSTGGHGVVINPSQSTELVNIEGCLIENNGGHGVYMVSGRFHKVTRVSVVGLGTFKSIIRNNAGYGVRIESGILQPVVELSDVTANQAGGVHVLTNQARVSSNRIFQNAGPGAAAASGVRLGSASNLVEVNQIHSNTGAGVLVEAGKTNVQNDICENETFANGGLGIDLGANGVSCNDAAQDADGVQNYPKLNPLWQLSGGSVRVRGTLHSSANHPFTLHFYVADAEGEGAAYLASRTVQTNASGNATFDFTNLPPTYYSNFLSQQLTLAPDDPIVATATPSGPRATSEFSNPAYGQGDTNQDGAITAADIDVLYDQFGGSSNPLYDLDGDGTVNQADVDRLVRVILRTEYGDLDLDRDIDLTDFGVLKDHFGQPGGWAIGDLNGNDTVDLSDFGLLKANFGFSGPCP